MQPRQHMTVARMRQLQQTTEALALRVDAALETHAVPGVTQAHVVLEGLTHEQAVSLARMYSSPGYEFRVTCRGDNSLEFAWSATPPPPPVCKCAFCPGAAVHTEEASQSAFCDSHRCKHCKDSIARPVQAAGTRCSRCQPPAASKLLKRGRSKDDERTSEDESPSKRSRTLTASLTGALI